MPYHHGNLREALVDAGVALARAGGPDAVVLRAATREAGVSHNAAYRPFADRDASLAAVCERCFAELGARMLEEQAATRTHATADPVVDAWGDLDAVGRAYVHFAVDEPGWFRTAFGVPDTVTPPVDFASEPGPVAADPYGILRAGLDRLVAVGAVPPQRREGAETVAWAAVHGLASLLVDGPLRAASTAERTSMIDRVVASVADALRAPLDRQAESGGRRADGAVTP